jgi:hypothetical protein
MLYKKATCYISVSYGHEVEGGLFGGVETVLVYEPLL